MPPQVSCRARELGRKQPPTQTPCRKWVIRLRQKGPAFHVGRRRREVPAH